MSDLLQQYFIPCEHKNGMTFTALNFEKYAQAVLVAAKQLTQAVELIATNTSEEITHYFSQVHLANQFQNKEKLREG